MQYFAPGTFGPRILSSREISAPYQLGPIQFWFLGMLVPYHFDRATFGSRRFQPQDSSLQERLSPGYLGRGISAHENFGAGHLMTLNINAPGLKRPGAKLSRTENARMIS